MASVCCSSCIFVHNLYEGKTAVALKFFNSKYHWADEEENQEIKTSVFVCWFRGPISLLKDKETKTIDVHDNFAVEITIIDSAGAEKCVILFWSKFLWRLDLPTLLALFITVPKSCSSALTWPTRAHSTSWSRNGTLLVSSWCSHSGFLKPLKKQKRKKLSRLLLLSGPRMIWSMAYIRLLLFIC